MVIVSVVLSAPALQPSDVFEQPHPAGQKKIEFHISVPEVAAIVEGSGPGQPDDGGRGKGFPVLTLNIHFLQLFFIPK